MSIAFSPSKSPVYSPIYPLVNGAVFSPSYLANLALWLDASDTSTITQSAGAVSQWDDKSGNDNHAIQATGAKQPTTGLATINGLNALTLVPNQYMGLTSEISGSGYTFFVVSAVNDTGTNKLILTGNSGSPSLQIDGAEQVDIIRTAQAAILSGTTSVSTSNASIVAAVTTSGDNRTYIDGVLSDSNATDPAYTGGINKILANLYNDWGFSGDVGAILIFTRVLTNTEMNQVGNYLADKWGISWTDL